MIKGVDMSNKKILQKRYDDRNKGSSRIQALDFKGKEITFWKPKAGKNYLNFLYYKIATENHPLVKSKDANVGDEDFILDFWVHQYVGPYSCDIICPKKTFNKACPICEAGQKYRDEGKDDEAGKCRPTHKAVYNVVDEMDRDKGVQVAILSHKNFQQEMMDEAGDTGDEEGIIDFPDFKEGKVVKFRAEEESFNKNKYFEFKSFKFEDRSEPLSKSLKEQILSLDEYMVIHSYDKIRSLFYGDDSEDESKDEIEDESKDEIEDELKDEIEDYPPKSRNKKNEEEENEEDDMPKKSKNKYRDEKEDDDDEKEDEKEDEKDEKDDEDSTLESAKKAIKCPHKHTYGKDWDQFKECEDCDIWGNCGKASKVLRAKK